jgi:hypothetical protein
MSGTKTTKMGGYQEQEVDKTGIKVIVLAVGIL